MSSHRIVVYIIYYRPRKYWRDIDDSCTNYSYRKSSQCLNSRNGWKFVKLSASSTFADYHAQRVVLVKRVAVYPWVQLSEYWSNQSIMKNPYPYSMWPHYCFTENQSRDFIKAHALMNILRSL